MKKSRLLVVLITLLVMIPSIVYATPKGFLEVKITPKNFSKYLGVEKVKQDYTYRIYSKLRKKGYYVYGFKNFKIEFTYADLCKTEDSSHIDRPIIGESYLEGTFGWWKDGEISDFKVLKAKGKIIFIKPNNVKAVKAVKLKKKVHHYDIILKRRYNKHTSYEYTQKGKKYYYVSVYVTKKSEIP